MSKNWGTKVLQQIARMKGPIIDPPIKDFPVEKIVGETLAFLANEYSGADHEELWRRISAILAEIERLRSRKELGDE